MARPLVLQLLKNVPNEPGVYLFKDDKDHILYVGKAKALKKRMSSYFHKSHADNTKIQFLVEVIDSFEFIVTASEFEALILESNLIKLHQPVFNTSLRDDKSYPYLAISYDEEFPRIFITRELHRKGTLYFGPHTRVYALRRTLDMLRNLFPIRTYARKRPDKPNARPFMDYHIKWRLNGTVKELDATAYRKVIDQIRDFLDGRNLELIDEIEQEMQQASENKQFEKAAKLRDRIVAARFLQEQQKVISASKIDRDVIGLADTDGQVYARILHVRNGKLVGSRGFVLDKQQVEDDALTSLVETYYNGAAYVPQEVLLPHAIDDQDVIEAWLKEKRGRKVSLLTPARGEKKGLVEMATANAKYAYEVYRINQAPAVDQAEAVLGSLQVDLGLAGPPYRIECFDISTLRGAETVGSMVVFENARPKRSDYRRFRVKRAEGQDDFASMVEVLKRRLKHLSEPIPEGKFATRPDLLVVDGGKPQLSAARKALDEVGLDIPVVALAKREEELYIPSRSQALVLPRRAPSLRLLQHLRDEAHRFAVQYHRGLRTKDMLVSTFDNIPGVGARRKRLLFKYLETPEGVCEASLDELKAVPGIPAKVAEDIYEYLHGGESGQQ